MLKKIRALFDQPRLHLGTLPALIFGVGFLALGWLTLDLGFFQDDWHHVYFFSHAGFDGLRRFALNDGRPLAFVVYDSLFVLLGVEPLGWHIALFLFRAFTTLVFLGVLNIVWEGFFKENAVISLLFLLYPVYLLQPLSVSYALHWSMYLVYMLSVLAMLLAIRRPRYFFSLTLLAVLLQAFHLLMIEYYFGIELLRPFFLWFVLHDDSRRQHLRRTFLAWLPYLLVDLLYIFYRSSYSRLYGYERFSDIVILNLSGKPLEFLSFYLGAAFQDFTEILFSNWHDTFNPGLFDFSSRSGVIIWAIVLLSIFGLWIYLQLLRADEHAPESESRWARQMIGTGLLAILLGISPGWAVGKTVFGSNPLWNDRFAMAAMFGAGMVWTGVIYLLIPNPRNRLLLLSILLSLGIGINLRTEVSFKRSWEKQLNFYWQLYWRAPMIDPHTLLVSDGEFLFYMGETPTAFAVNTLYPQSVLPPQVNYWVVAGSDRMPDWDSFRAGTPLQLGAHSATYQGQSADNLTISFQPEAGECLWVLSPQYGDYPFLSAGTFESLPVSSLSRVQIKPLNDWFPSSDIFGPEPKHGWCYYFEKADLAAQYSDWDQVLRLWKEAQEKGLGPGHGVEFFPFIRAYASLGQWDNAVQLSITSSKISSRMEGAICNLWARMKTDIPDLRSHPEVLRRINDRFQCGL